MVYVDDMETEYEHFRGRYTQVMCHMIADTRSELLSMADKIGVKRKWLQHPDTYSEHFDICKSKRKLAVRAGAQEITWRELAMKLRERRKQPSDAYLK